MKYILENNIDDSELAEATGLDELSFSEEVYDQNGRLAKVNSRETRPDTRLPQSRAGGQGQYLSY